MSRWRRMLGRQARSGFSAKGERMTNESDRFYGDPDNVRKVELLPEPPGHEDVRVTVEYVTGAIMVFTVDKSVLTLLLKDLHAMESET